MHIASLGLKVCMAPPERELMSMPRKTPVPGRPRKSPLRVAAGSARFAAAGQPAVAGQPPGEMTGEQLRAMMISEFCQGLRSRTNKEKRPFLEETVTAYKWPRGRLMCD
jgi:hypothetical protein